MRESIRGVNNTLVISKQLPHRHLIESITLALSKSRTLPGRTTNVRLLPKTLK